MLGRGGYVRNVGELMARSDGVAPMEAVDRGDGSARERFFVTGATGCIGAWTVRLLLDQGVEVIAGDLKEDWHRLQLVSHPRPAEKVDFVELDVTRPEAVARAVRDYGANRVIHLAGLQIPACANDPALGALVNVVGTVNVFEAVRTAGVTGIGLAYASSAAVFGPAASYRAGVVADDSPLGPSTHYGVYKVANEGTARIYATQGGLGSIGLRPFTVYGPGRDQGMTSDATVAVLAAVAGHPFHIKFGGSVLMTYAADCALAFIGAARAAVGTGEAICCNVPGWRVSTAALAELIEELLPDARGLITYESSTLAAPSLLSAPVLASVIGTVPNRSLRDGLQATIELFRGALADGLVTAPGC